MENEINKILVLTHKLKKKYYYGLISKDEALKQLGEEIEQSKLIEDFDFVELK